MRQTAPIGAHRPTPRTNIAAHAEAVRERENRESRRAQAIMRAIAEKGNIALCAPAALRLELGKFKLRRAATELTEGEYLFVAISERTGEIRKYATRYHENIKFIGNADYILNNREKTIYMTFVRTGTENTSWRQTDRREAGN